MKGPLVTTPVRRVAAALALGAALVTAGCGTTEAGRAATVDGRVITENEVQVAQAQINKTFPGANLTGDQVLGRLIGAPVYLDEIAQQGAPVSESLARTAYQQQDTYDGEARPTRRSMCCGRSWPSSSSPSPARRCRPRR